MDPLYPYQGNYNNGPRMMHTWNGYNGPQPPQYPEYVPYPPPMHAYVPAQQVPGAYGRHPSQAYGRPPSYHGEPHSQNHQRFRGGGYGSYHQGRSHQNWNHLPPRGSNYPKKVLPQPSPTTTSVTIPPNTSKSIIKEDTSIVDNIPPGPASKDAPNNIQSITKIEVPEAPVVDSQTASEEVPQDIKQEDKKNVMQMVNLCEDQETPEERLNRFHFETRTNILQQLCGCQDESQFIMALRSFKEALESQNGEIKMKSELMNLLGKYLPFLAKNYKVIGTGCVDDYLAIMEDIIVVYCKLVRDFIHVQSERKKKRNLSRLAARIRYLMTICLLYRMDSIIHCLFKVPLYPAEAEYSRMWTYVFVYFLKRAKYSLQSADYLRCFIGWQKMKTIRGNTTVDEIDGVMLSRFNKSIVELKELGITCLTEIIESMENDPRYCVRDMIRRYWSWWNVEKPKDFLADLEEPTTLILPGEAEDNHEPVFEVQEEIDPITRLFQEKRARKRIDLTQIALNFNRDAEAGDFHFSFTNGAQFGSVAEDVSGPIIIEDSITIEEEPDDLIVPPSVIDTVVIDSDEDDDVIIIGEPEETAPAPVQTPNNDTEPETVPRSPASPAIAEEVLEEDSAPEPQKNTLEEPPDSPSPGVPIVIAPSEEVDERGNSEAAASPSEPAAVVRSLFGTLTQEDLELEDTFHMDFAAEDGDRLPDIPDNLMLPKSENLFGDSDDEWSNLDMNTVLDSIGDASMDCNVPVGECRAAAALFDGGRGETVKVERAEKESPEKEGAVESQESTRQPEKAETPPSNPLEEPSAEPPQKASQNHSPESSEMPSATRTTENPTSTSAETKDSEAAPLETPSCPTDTVKSPTAVGVELNEPPSRSSEMPPENIGEIDGSGEGAAATLNANEKLEGGKEQQALVIELEQLSKEIMGRNEGVDITSLGNNSVEDFLTCVPNVEEVPSNKMSDDIDDLQQMYLRESHAAKSRDSSCSLEAPPFESLDKKEVRRFFDENLSRNGPSPSVGPCSNPAPDSTDTVANSATKDRRFRGGTAETSRRRRPSEVSSPAHQIRQSWSEVIADAMAITHGSESYEEFIAREEALVIDQSRKRSARADLSGNRPIVDVWTNFVPDTPLITGGSSEPTSNDSLMDLAGPCADEEALVIQCRLFVGIKQEDPNVVSASAHQLTPDWGTDDRHYAPTSTTTTNYGTSLVAHPSPPYSCENSPNDGESATNGNVHSPRLYSPLLKDSRGLSSFYISDLVGEEVTAAGKVQSSSPATDNNNWSRASPKQNSVKFLEEVSKQFYATEFGGDLDGYSANKGNNVSRASPPKPATQTAAQAAHQSTARPSLRTSTKSPVRPHITAEAELLLPPNNGGSAVTVTTASSIPPPSPAAPWNNRNSAVSRVDPQLYKNRQAPKKAKVNGGDLNSRGRREVVVNEELVKYKNPPQLDVKFLYNVAGEEYSASVAKQADFLDYSLSNFVLNQPANVQNFFYPDTVYQPEMFVVPLEEPVPKNESGETDGHEVALINLPRVGLRDSLEEKPPVHAPHESFSNKQERLPDVSTLRDPTKNYTQPVAMEQQQQQQQQDNVALASLTSERQGAADNDQKLPLPPKKRKMTEDEEIAYILQRIREEKEEREKRGAGSTNPETENISYPAQRQMSIADLQRDFPRVKTLAARKLYPDRDSYQYPPDFDEYRRFRDKQSIMNVYINGMGDVRDCGGNNYPVCLMINAMPPCVHHQNLVNDGQQQNESSQPVPQAPVVPAQAREQQAPVAIPNFPERQQQQQRYLPPQVELPVRGRRGRRANVAQGGSPPAKRGRGRPRKNP